MPALRVIINADDLGISREVNDAIFRLMASRRISSATLIANAPAVREAAAELKRFPACSFGAHLNLTQFEPVSNNARTRLLVDETGQLSRHIETAAPTLARIRGIFDEWCAQIEVLASLGVNISHLDSHHHVHTRPHVFPALKAVQKRYGIRRVRLSKNLYAPDQPCSTTLAWQKRVYNWSLRHVYATATTDAFTELLSFREISRAEVGAYRTIELMTHPGASYATEEVALLESDWFAREGHGATLVAYTDLRG